MGGAHNGGFGAGPGPEETGGVGAPAGWGFSWVGVVEKRGEIGWVVLRDVPHAVISRAGTRTKYYRELWYFRTCNRRDQLRTVLGNAAPFGLGADHEAADVLEKEQGDTTLAAKLNKVRAFEGGFGEEDAVVG